MNNPQQMNYPYPPSPTRSLQTIIHPSSIKSRIQQSSINLECIICCHPFNTQGHTPMVICMKSNIIHPQCLQCIKDKKVLKRQVDGEDKYLCSLCLSPVLEQSLKNFKKHEQLIAWLELVEELKLKHVKDKEFYQKYITAKDEQIEAQRIGFRLQKEKLRNENLILEKQLALKIHQNRQIAEQFEALSEYNHSILREIQDEKEKRLLVGFELNYESVKWKEHAKEAIREKQVMKKRLKEDVAKTIKLEDKIMQLSGEVNQLRKMCKFEENHVKTTEKASINEVGKQVGIKQPQSSRQILSFVQKDMKQLRGEMKQQLELGLNLSEAE